MELSSVYIPVEEDLVKVREALRNLGSPSSPWLFSPLDYLTQSSGKQVRSAITLLAGRFYNYNIDILLPMAAAVELLHTASLVHDDAVDGATTRRGNATIGALWGDATAVLLGDYLFANAAEMVSRTQNVRVMRLFAQTLMTMASGELGELSHVFDLNQTREQYYDRIACKTASLMSMAMESGAVLSNAPEDAVASLRSYGNNVGLAFQIVDDILDFVGSEDEMGKPVGSDLANGILTLPTILLIERSPEDNPVKRFVNNGKSPAELSYVVEAVSDLRLMDECYSIASDFYNRACSDLDRFPDNSEKRALLELASYVIRRRK